tara:strand:+ start:11902 stop:12513 length:612 start_codon:yes stop_codon:yes gene_type:complete
MKEQFAELILNNKFCVVGNSPKETGSGNGSLIDSYDIVIRFKNYDTTEDHSEDYGKKTDVWSTPFNLTQFYRDPAQYKASLCCLPLHIPRWRLYFGKWNIDYDVLGRYEDVVQYVPHKWFEEVWYKYESGQPSSGIITLYWMYKILGRKLKSEDLFGFGLFDPEEPHHYFNRKESDISKEWRKSTHLTHPRKIEKRIWREIVE